MSALQEQNVLSREEVERIVRRLCDGIAPLFPNDRMEAILFGSYARGDAEEDSDIDVMILLDASREEIAKRNWKVGNVAAEFLVEDGILVSPIVENRAFFRHWVDDMPFFRNVKREGVTLCG